MWRNRPTLALRLALKDLDHRLELLTELVQLLEAQLDVQGECQPERRSDDPTES